MEIRALEIPDVKLVVPRRFGDARGYFCETWNSRRAAEAGLDIPFVQDNESLSAEPGTVRGLHYQSPPEPQAKLVRVAQGAVMDVAVDVRKGSPWFGQWVRAELSAENGHQLFVPRGFLHGFATLTPDALVMYKVDGFYAPACDGAVRWDDPDLGIDWGIDAGAAKLSDKDAAAPAFKEFETPFTYEAGS